MFVDLAQNCGTLGAENYCGSVTEHGSDLEASRAFDVHEEAVGGLHKALKLVLLLFVHSGGVKQVVINLNRVSHQSKRKRKEPAWGKRRKSK